MNIYIQFKRLQAVTSGYKRLQAVLILVILVYQTGFAQNNPPPMSFGCAIDSVQMPSLPENFQYICTDPNVVKYIRVNIHYMLKGDILGFTVNTCNQSIDYKGYGNFTPYSNGFYSANADPAGPLDFSYNGFDRAEDVVNEMNNWLNSIEDHWRKANDSLILNPPLTNVNYPIPPPNPKIQFILGGVYFHEDPTADNPYQFDDWQSNYSVNPMTDINVYYHSDASAPGDGKAPGYGGTIKYNTHGEYFYYVSPGCREWSLWLASIGALHEICHNLGLYHTSNESFDNCDDTPPMPVYDKWENGVCMSKTYMNCWAYNEHPDSNAVCPGSSNYPCDEWKEISNNLGL